MSYINCIPRPLGQWLIINICNILEKRLVHALVLPQINNMLREGQYLPLSITYRVKYMHLVPELVQSGIIKHVSLFGVVILQGVGLQWPCVPFPIHAILCQDHCDTDEKRRRLFNDAAGNSLDKSLYSLITTVCVTKCTLRLPLKCTHNSENSRRICLPNDPLRRSRAGKRTRS